ncbi:MAG TPA: arsenate reductase ArsC [Nitrospiria bacterium]
MGPPEEKVKVLFLCTGNSARSQMAEGLARHLGKGAVEAHSAGLEPRGLNPLAVSAMDEVGIDIRDQTSKGIDPDRLKRMDWVITVCGNAQEKCPVPPETVRRDHWPLEDPAAVAGEESERLRFFRKVRDELADRVRRFISEAVNLPPSRL